MIVARMRLAAFKKNCIATGSDFAHAALKGKSSRPLQDGSLINVLDLERLTSYRPRRPRDP